jgi:hypothetical protein
MAQNQNADNPNAGEDMKSQELIFITLGNGAWYSQFGRQFSHFLQN